MPCLVLNGVKRTTHFSISMRWSKRAGVKTPRYRCPISILSQNLHLIPIHDRHKI